MSLNKLTNAKILSVANFEGQCENTYNFVLSYKASNK